MSEWDSLIRGVSLCASILIGFLFWFPRPLRLVTLCGTALALATIAFNLSQFPPVHAAPLWRGGFVMAALTAPFWFWAAIQLLFEDRRELPPLSWLALAALIAGGATLQIMDRGAWRFALGLLVRGGGLALVAHAGWTVLRGRAGDLVAGRLALRSRLFVILCLGVVGFVAISVVLPLVTRPDPALSTGFVALLQLAACFLMFTPNLALIPVEPSAAPLPSPEAERLLAFMDSEKPWKDPELTVARLAGKLAIPEYRLRKAINQTLGARNFAAFLNGYRLRAAADALTRSPKTPILTIALDHGFGSIGPFNRAFREHFGTTPSAWRKKNL